ncbi:hypothetical protein [Campylobacter sp.]|uniref:hypothetical protein n=1 Tax=Campylobacter sp. TaxID=205 RepID=UPI002AA79C6B|nr:hypothetical protein [Campylobacter sp.]MCI7447334.1 hypothetical protein [Campylobacter sp.]
MPIFQGSRRRKMVRKILKGDGLSSCDFSTINAQAKPAYKNPAKLKNKLTP